MSGLNDVMLFYRSCTVSAMKKRALAPCASSSVEELSHCSMADGNSSVLCSSEGVRQVQQLSRECSVLSLICYGIFDILTLI